VGAELAELVEMVESAGLVLGVLVALGSYQQVVSGLTLFIQHPYVSEVVDMEENLA
jgi:hypothetical protein